MRTLIMLLVAASLAPAAQAWDTKKFNAKALEKEWGLPVFSKNVVGSEVIVNDEDRQKSAEWAVKKVETDVVVKFYTEKLKVEPDHKTSDVGDERYTYKLPFDKEKRILRRVYVKFVTEDRFVHIRFAESQIPEGDEIPED
jgi:hypothetical protein